TSGIRERCPIGPYVVGSETIPRERGHRREDDPAVHRVGRSEREPSSVRRERPRDDAVADVEWLVRPPRIERGQLSTAEPELASIHRSVGSLNRRWTISSGRTVLSIGAWTLTGVLPTSAVTSVCEPSGSTTRTVAGTPSD